MRFLHRLVISLAVSLVGHLGLNHSPDWVFLVLSSKLNVFGQLCNFTFEPRDLSFRLSEVFLHLIYWFAHNFPQPCCCLGALTMGPGGPREPRKISSFIMDTMTCASVAALPPLDVVQNKKRPVVPEAEFTPLDLSCITRYWFFHNLGDIYLFKMKVIFYILWYATGWEDVTAQYIGGHALSCYRSVPSGERCRGDREAAGCTLGQCITLAYKMAARWTEGS